MATRSRLALFVLIGGILTSEASAQGDVLGVGVANCRELLATEEGRFAAWNWSAGYLSGLNSARLLSGIPARDISKIEKDSYLEALVAGCQEDADTKALQLLLQLFDVLPVIE